MPAIPWEAKPNEINVSEASSRLQSLSLIQFGACFRAEPQVKEMEYAQRSCRANEGRTGMLIQRDRRRRAFLS